jgi:glycosyltransferase involved in cell wall biosynthesis
MDSVDILLATYNGEKYLKEQIDSILSQTHTAFRLIVSDDGSTDSTKRILADYKNIDSRIELHFQEKNLGYIKNFEFLLKQVKSKYYMLSDQDDVWDAEKVRISLDTLKREKAVLVFSDLLVVNENLEMINRSFWKMISVERKIMRFHDYRLVYLYNCVTGCTILSESKYIDKILPIPSGSWIAHDYWVALVLSQHGKLYAIEKPLINYRQHGNNQIGAFNVSRDKTKPYEEKRHKYIKHRIEQFQTFCDYNEKFNLFLQKKNALALNYFKDVHNKKYFNFKGYGIFHFIFKSDTLDFYLRNFIYLNSPFVLRILDYLRAKLYSKK